MTNLVDVNTVRDLLSDGKYYDLAHPLKQGMPHSPTQPPFMYSMVKKHNDFVNDCFSSAADIFVMGIHQGTHIDALGHVSEHGKIFGGFDASSNQDVSRGLAQHDISSLPPIVARGRLLDVAGYLGKDYLDQDYSITADDLEATALKQGTNLERGDVALVRTGWASLFHDTARYFAVRGPSFPGISVEAAQWLVDRGVRAVGADNAALERRSGMGPVHRLLLVRSGIAIMENLVLNDLAKEKIYTFLFLALPLSIVGGTGSPIRPIAIV